MATNITIFDGNPIWNTESVPFHFYDTDVQFQEDAVKVAKFCSFRLGYPLTQIELQSSSFFTAFEEAVTTYGNEVYNFKVKENYLSIEGTSTASFLNDIVIKPNLGNIIKISDQYGSEAGVGGDVTWRSGLLQLTSSIQDYDLNAWATSQGISSSDMEVKRIFHQAIPAITRFFDPYAGTGTGTQGLIDAFGFGNMSPGINFLLMPVGDTIQRLQGIELNDQVRRSQYSFELTNNQLRVFPIPRTVTRKTALRFEYILKSDRIKQSSSPDQVSDISKVPYSNPTYSKINSIGRQWIFEYTLALSKEMLGYVRGKYGSIPIPGSDVTLNQSDLISAATSEKTALVTKLREDLEGFTRKAQMQQRNEIEQAQNSSLSNIPLPLYIG